MVLTIRKVASVGVADKEVTKLLEGGWGTPSTAPASDDFFSLVDSWLTEGVAAPGSPGSKFVREECPRSGTPFKVSPKTTELARRAPLKRRREGPIELADDSDHVSPRPMHDSSSQSISRP